MLNIVDQLGVILTIGNYQQSYFNNSNPYKFPIFFNNNEHYFNIKILKLNINLI